MLGFAIGDGDSVEPRSGETVDEADEDTAVPGVYEETVAKAPRLGLSAGCGSCACADVG
jgi:hypothetical protein